MFGYSSLRSLMIYGMHQLQQTERGKKKVAHIVESRNFNHSYNACISLLHAQRVILKML